MMLSIIALTSLVVILGYSFMIYNNLIASKHDVDRAWANIDVLLKQRHDEIPKLVSTVESYMAYEKQTLQGIIEARSRYLGATNSNDQLRADQDLRRGLSGLFALAENYPELKADRQFQELQKRISQIETSIADRREFYNASANHWNMSLEQVPELAYAKIFRFQPKNLYEASEQERADVSVKIQVPKAS